MVATNFVDYGEAVDSFYWWTWPEEYGNENELQAVATVFNFAYGAAGAHQVLARWELSPRGGHYAESPVIKYGPAPVDVIGEIGRGLYMLMPGGSLPGTGHWSWSSSVGTGGGGLGDEGYWGERLERLRALGSGDGEAGGSIGLGTEADWWGRVSDTAGVVSVQSYTVGGGGSHLTPSYLRVQEPDGYAGTRALYAVRSSHMSVQQWEDVVNIDRQLRQEIVWEESESGALSYDRMWVMASDLVPATAVTERVYEQHKTKFLFRLRVAREPSYVE